MKKRKDSEQDSVTNIKGLMGMLEEKEKGEDVTEVVVLRDLKPNDVVLFSVDTTELTHADLKMLSDSLKHLLKCKIVLLPNGIDIYSVKVENQSEEKE